MTNSFIKTAVIGHPINHSKSPLIHNYWLDSYGLSGSYEAIDISTKNLKRSVQDLINQGYKGFNVTVPHKIAIMNLCDEIDELAHEIGAVNTVSIRNKKLYGTNSDAYGFIQNIKQNVPDFDFTAGKAVVLGAGGAANAVIYALLHENVPEIIILNRTKEKSKALTALDRRKLVAGEWKMRNDYLSNSNLIVNTTALGMSGKPPLEIDLTSAPKTALVTDIVYAPLHTDLLKQAKDRDLRTVTGIGMLLHQARTGFKLWNGVMPSVTKELEKLVLK